MTSFFREEHDKSYVKSLSPLTKQINKAKAKTKSLFLYRFIYLAIYHSTMRTFLVIDPF